jgi:hypothetical protein
MKKKLMILGLMAGGSMFAATRFSVGVSVGRVDPACAPPIYNSYVSPGYYSGYVNGYSGGYRYDRSYDRFRDSRNFRRDRDHDRDDRGRDWDDRRWNTNDWRRR